FLKVARIVGAAMGAISDIPRNVPVAIYAQRVAHLVRTGQMESQGDLRMPEFSEVRLPPPPLPRIELEELIAKGDYLTLAHLYEEGQGVARDYAAAFHW